MTDVENQKSPNDSMTQSDPSHATTAPMYAPPPYMPPPYPMGPAMYPQPVPVQVCVIQPDLPPEEAGVIKTEEPNLAGTLLFLRSI